jgi:hypothetical protein
MQYFRAITAVMLIAVAGVSQAQPPATPKVPLADCVNLGADHEAFRFGNQYLLVHDGDAHYRLSFYGNCEALGLATQVRISTSGEANRLCPKATRVESRTQSCTVRSVDRIDAADYARFQRKAR